MKFKSISLICTAAALSLGAVAASAATPAPAPAATPAPAAMDATTLGRLDALFTVCAKADKTNQAVYEQRRADMIVFGEGTRYEMRVSGSDTPEYKAAYAEIVETAGKTSAEDLLSQCSRMIGADVTKKQD